MSESIRDGNNNGSPITLGNFTGRRIPSESSQPTLSQRIKYYFRYALAVQRRPPWLTVSQVLWVVFGGWSLFIGYVLGAIAMAPTIILLPFAWQSLKLGMFALLPIGREPYVPGPLPGTDPKAFVNATRDPSHPLTIAANIVWLVLIGWEMALLHVIWAIVQFMTIVGIANGVQHLRLAKFALWPFGKYIKTATPPPFPTWPGIRVPDDEV